MKAKIKLLTLLAFISVQLMAQEQQENQPYNVGLGFRISSVSSGFSGKFFIKERKAIEAILSGGGRAVFMTGLYEVHRPVPEAEGLCWFYGGGGHIGFYDAGRTMLFYDGHRDRVYIKNNKTAVVPGIDGIVGMEYKIKNAPITLGFDIKPFIDFYDVPYLYFDGALSFRFVW